MKENETGMEDFGCDLEPKPIIKKLEEALRQDSVVHLEGYVGSSVEGTLRLYKNLNLESYVEVSKEEVIACVEIPNDNCGRVKVFIPASTKVKLLTQSFARRSAPKSTAPKSTARTYGMSLSFLCDLASQLIQEGDLNPETLAAVKDFYNNHCN